MKVSNKPLIKLDKNDWSYSWDDDGMLGDLTIKCPCGKRTKPFTFQIGDKDDEDYLVCECGRKFIVKRATDVYYEEKC